MQSWIKLMVGLILFGFSAVLLLLLIFLKPHRAAFLKLLLCFVFIASALLESYAFIDRKKEQFDSLIGTEAEAECLIVSRKYTAVYASSFDVIASINGISFNSILDCEYAGDFSVGDLVTGTVSVAPIGEKYQNTDYYLARGIRVYLTSFTDSLETVETGLVNFSIQMQRLNTRLSRIFELEIGGDEADLASAITLGNKDLLANDIVRDFGRCGLSHILAISGMHLSIIMTALEALLNRIGIRKKWRCFWVFSIALFFLALTGFSLSTVRAFIMMTFVYLASLAHADNDAITSLFFSLFIILAVSPESVHDIGLWLSVLAVLGILVFNELNKYFKKKLYQSHLNKRAAKILLSLISALGITLAVNIFVCFLIWLYFGELSLVAPLTNWVISPLANLFLFLSPIKLITSIFSPLAFLSQPLTEVLRLIGGLMIDIIAEMSSWESITVSLEYRFAGYIILPASLLLLVCLILPLRRKIWIPLIPTVASLIFCGCLMHYNHTNADKITLDFLSSGESEMMVLTTTKDTVICDVSTGANKYLYEAIAFSEQRMSTEVSALVLTHYHSYHISTFSKNADRFMIRKLYLPIPQNENEHSFMQSLINVSQNKGIDVVIFDSNKPLSPTENITLELSERVLLSRSTHPTFVLTVSAFGDQLTYIAESAHDSEILREKASREIETADYVIFGTHGPITKTDFSYEGLSDKQYVVIFDENVLSHFDPSDTRNLIVESSVVTFRFEADD